MIRMFFALFCFLGLTVAAHADTLTLAPKYDVAGTNPDGSKYAGTATIEVISDTSFTIHWDTGSPVLEGSGLRTSDLVAATFMLENDPGLIIYKVDDSGVLNGLWSIRGRDGTGTERLTPQK